MHKYKCRSFPNTHVMQGKCRHENETRFEQSINKISNMKYHIYYNHLKLNIIRYARHHKQCK